jgi:hypothetical protein
MNYYEEVYGKKQAELVKLGFSGAQCALQTCRGAETVDSPVSKTGGPQAREGSIPSLGTDS